MKKIKLLTPIFGLSIIATIAPVITSCSNSTRVIPTDLYKTNDYTLQGFKKDTDVSNYNTLSIPEGIKYVDNNAFKDELVTGKTNGTIRTIVFPKTARTIRASAFENCDSIRVLDFSSWTVNEINDASFASTYDTNISPAFAGTSLIGKVIMNNNLSEQSKKTLKEKLMAAGIAESWFGQEPINQKITADKAWMDQKIENGSTKYLFKLDNKLADDERLYATVTKTSGTKNVDVETTQEKLTPNSDNVVELPVNLVNNENTGDYVKFDVSFALIQDATLETEAKTLWVQTISGFTLTNIKTDKVLVKSITITADSALITPNELLPINVEVLPANATNKEYELKSSDEDVATVDESGIKGVSNGVATITATAKDGSGKVGTFDVIVFQQDQPGEPVYPIDEYDEKMEIFTHEVSEDYFELNKEYKFEFNSRCVEEQGLGSFKFKGIGIIEDTMVHNGIHSTDFSLKGTVAGQELELTKGTDYFYDSNYFGIVLSQEYQDLLEAAIAAGNNYSLEFTIKFTNLTPEQEGNELYLATLVNMG